MESILRNGLLPDWDCQWVDRCAADDFGSEITLALHLIPDLPNFHRAATGTQLTFGSNWPMPKEAAEDSSANFPGSRWRLQKPIKSANFTTHKAVKWKPWPLEQGFGSNLALVPSPWEHIVSRALPPLVSVGGATLAPFLCQAFKYYRICSQTGRWQWLSSIFVKGELGGANEQCRCISTGSNVRKVPVRDLPSRDVTGTIA